MGDLELQVLDVLTVGVAGWTVESEIGLESWSAIQDDLEAV